MAGTEALQVEHSCTLDAGVASVWRALLDAERVSACVADATISLTADGVAAGRLKVRFGAVNPTYRATAQVRERNARAHRIVLAIDGTDARGSGTLTAAVSASVRRSGAATLLQFEADVEVTGRPAELSAARRGAAVQRMIEQFADDLIETFNEGDAVADQPAEDPFAPDLAGATGAARKRPKPTRADAQDMPAAPISGAAPQPPEQVGDDPTTVEPAPDVVPADLDEEPAQESMLDSAAEPAGESVVDPVVGPGAESPAAASITLPAFSTPEVIPVPSLHDEPSVNGHSPASRSYPDESPLATSTRQAIAKRVAPVALGFVFILAAARRRRGKRP